MDRISDLPDSILSNILSLLPIKFAVGTCILSRRWQNINPCGHKPIHLVLNDSLLVNPTQNETNPNFTSFKNFVDKLLYTTLQDGPGLESLDLECKNTYHEWDVVSWVSDALRLNVRRLTLNVALDDTNFLSERLDGCETLVSLTLFTKGNLFTGPFGISLPSLKTLVLEGMKFEDGDGGSVNELIEGCPLLEVLYMIECEVSRVKKISIKCPFLKRLILEKNWLSSVKNITILEIEAPSLEYFKYIDMVACGYSITTFNYLFSAHINVGPTTEQMQEGYYDDYYEYYINEVDDDPWKCYTDVSKVVAACSNTQRLYLSQFSIQALHHTSQQMSQFQNITWLDFGYMRSVGWMVLACLLKNAPNLVHLGFREAFLKSVTGFADFELLVPNPPVCLEQRLKRIAFRKFDVSGDEIKLLNYVLQNGKVLEIMLLNTTEISLKQGQLIMQQNNDVVTMDSSCAVTSCSIAPPYDPRLVQIIRQVEAELAEQERVKRFCEQAEQYNQQSQLRSSTRS